MNALNDNGTWTLVHLLGEKRLLDANGFSQLKSILMGLLLD